MGIFDKLFRKRITERPTLIEALEGIDRKDLEFKKPEANEKWVQSGLQEFYSIKVSQDLESFINKYTSEKLQTIIRAVDLQGLATHHNPWGTGSYHRTKVLELSRWLRKKEKWLDAEVCDEKLMEMLKWNNDTITPSDFLLLYDLAKDMMGYARDADKMVLGVDYSERKMNQALQVFDKLCLHASSGSEGYIDALAWKGACYLNLKNNEKAKETFQMVLNYDPNHKMAKEVMDYFKKG
ncbi:MAG: tetratricopeptide repeat protein [Candidatus Methanoperedens sp.]|nr:tetratricopeptide repeat protein [Candidatus Methanoperedens sp.]